MQPRLTRSITERMLFGVCGGLGEYFQIDPVLVRLIFVLVTFTSGVGLPVYIVLAVLMPRQRKAASVPYGAAQQPGTLPHPMDDPAQTYERVPHPVGGKTGGREVLVAQAQPAQHQQVAANPDLRAQQATGTTPYTEDTAEHAATGQTIRLPAGAETAAVPRRRNWRTLGFILLGIGMLILLEHLTFINSTLVFPLLLIVAGVVLLRRGRTR